MTETFLKSHLDWYSHQESTAPQEKPYHSLLLDWMEGAVDKAGDQAVEKLTPARWHAARLEARRRLYQNLGLDPLPPRISGAPPRLVGRLERDGYAIERLVLETRPNFFMPIHLYLPEGIPLPAPAILYAPGHWMINGKSEPDIQSCCIGLVKQGFVVLAFDPIGQGERGASFAEHGRRDLLLSGLSQEGLMAWESMRAIDYLLTRPEVDGNRIGMTGASGGGLNTIYTSAADERIAVVVPVCYVTSFSRFFRAMRDLNWNNAGDLCNQVPNVIRDAEMGGLCGLIHPRPLLVINGWLDPQFPVAGAQEVIDQVKDLYGIIDDRRLRLTAINADHGYDQEMRQAAYGWFAHWLQGRGDGKPLPEPPLTLEPPESPELKCFVDTPSIGSMTALRQLSRATARHWRKQTEFADADKSSLRQRLSECLGVHAPADAQVGLETPQAALEQAGIRSERHLLRPEPNLITPAFATRPSEAAPQRVFLFACDEGKLAEPGPALIERVLSMRSAVLAVDPRGIGETTPLPARPMTLATLDGKIAEFPTLPGFTLEFEAATDALMLGRSLLGAQISDLLFAVRYARRLYPEASVAIVGSGPRMALAALFAAALDESISSAWVDRLLPSLHLLVEEDEQVFPITAYVYGILRLADVPQVAGLIAPRALAITRPIGARLQDLPTGTAQRLLEWTVEMYHQFDAPAPVLVEAGTVQDLTELII